MRQEPEKEPILKWATAQCEKLAEVFKEASVNYDIGGDDLLFRVKMQTPVAGATKTKSLLVILVTREALEDHLLEKPIATEKFLNFLSARRASYIPKPYLDDVDIEEWKIGFDDVDDR